VLCISNTLLPIRAVPNTSFSVFGRIRIRIVVDGKKKTNASHKCARHALCNTIQSCWTLNVKLRRQKIMNILLLKSLTCMIRITERRTPHVSMEAMQSTSWPTVNETFPDAHLTACDLHCSGATAAWRAIHVTWSDRRPGYLARFRNLMPSLRACEYTLQYCSQRQQQGVHWPWVVNALHAQRSFWRRVQSTLRLIICVYGCADTAVLIIRIRLIFGSTIRSNTNSAFFHYSVPNRIRIDYSVQPYFQCGVT